MDKKIVALAVAMGLMPVLLICVNIGADQAAQVRKDLKEPLLALLAATEFTDSAELAKRIEAAEVSIKNFKDSLGKAAAPAPLPVQPAQQPVVAPTPDLVPVSQVQQPSPAPVVAPPAQEPVAPPAQQPVPLPQPESQPAPVQPSPAPEQQQQPQPQQQVPALPSVPEPQQQVQNPPVVAPAPAAPVEVAPPPTPAPVAPVEQPVLTPQDGMGINPMLVPMQPVIAGTELPAV